MRVSRARVGGFQGCSLTTSWLQRLARGILSRGVSVVRSASCRGRCTKRDQLERAPHHRDRRGAETSGKGVPAGSRVLHRFRHSATPHRKMGIEPIEDILGCETVSSNQQAGDQPWVARHVRRTPSGVVGRGSERWKPRDRTVGPTGDVRIRSNRAGSPSRKAQGVSTGREPRCNRSLSRGSCRGEKPRH